MGGCWAERTWGEHWYMCYTCILLMKISCGCKPIFAKLTLQRKSNKDTVIWGCALIECCISNIPGSVGRDKYYMYRYIYMYV